jgi:hypothetical protein
VSVHRRKEVTVVETRTCRQRETWSASSLPDHVLVHVSPADSDWIGPGHGDLSKAPLRSMQSLAIATQRHPQCLFVGTRRASIDMNERERRVLHGLRLQWNVRAWSVEVPPARSAESHATLRAPAAARRPHHTAMLGPCHPRRVALPSHANSRAHEGDVHERRDSLSAPRVALSR